VEIYARGKPLAALLQVGQLRIAENGGWTVTFLLIVAGRLAYRGERERGAV